MAEANISTLEEQFEKAAAYVASVAAQLDTEKLLFFYSRYKQAKDGPCTTKKPGMFSFQAKQKWDAWKNMGATSKDCAMSEYIEMVCAIEPNWEHLLGDKNSKGFGQLGVSVSTMLNTDDVIPPENKTVFDWAKEGNMEEVRRCLKKGVDVNAVDEDGMGLIHWVADRGNRPLMELLLQQRADVNLQDAFGQTALHYAASCGHCDVINSLLESGADLALRDSEESLASDLASDEDIKSLLK